MIISITSYIIYESRVSARSDTHVIIDPYLSIYCPPRLLLSTDDDSSRVETSRYSILSMELSFIII